MALLPISVVRHSSKSLAVFQDFIWHSTCPFVKGSPLILIRFHLLVGLPHIAHWSATILVESENAPKV